MKARSDEELVQMFLSAKGSVISDAAVNELFGRYTAKVAAWCYRVTGKRETAGDLAQEVLLRAYRHMDSFQGNAKFSTWLYVVARNHCFNHLKSLASEPCERSEELSLQLRDLAFPDPEAGIQKQQSQQTLRKLMTGVLDPTEVQVMSLHFAEELPLSAITKLLGLTNASGAKGYIVSAKRKLSAAAERWKRQTAARD